ncbi:MAG: amidase [Myxococcales bacterium]|nr:amidase [Myxococcales bacterium]
MGALRDLDCVATAARIREGSCSAAEAVDAAVARIRAGNPSLNAVITPLFDRAAEQLASPRDAPFYGVPFLLKDLGLQMAGTPYFAGNRALRDADHRSTGTSVSVARLRRAGFVILGKTNTPELGTQPTTEPLATGATRNPYDRTRSSGGSSGGSAAAVAARFVPAAHASDGGGSIRIPASCCGLVGLKPSRGRITQAPFAGEAWAGCATDGVVTRSVRDSAALLDILAGPEPGDPYSAPPPACSFAEAIRRPPDPLRVALAWERPREGVAVDPTCRRAVELTGAALEALGHHVEWSRPAVWDEEAIHQRFSEIVAICTAKDLDELEIRLGRPLAREDVEPMNWEIAARGRAAGSTRYPVCLDAMHAFARQFAGFFADAPGWDVLVTPTLPELPPILGSFAAGAGDPLRGYRRAASMVAYTAPVNVAGLPAISLPLHASENGLPVGVQFVAPYGLEARLLALAAQLEAAWPWADRRPPE